MLGLCLPLAVWTSSDAQVADPAYVDGVVYFKIHDTSSVAITPGSFPQGFSEIVTTYSVTQVVKPFKVPDFPLQRIYKAVFTDIYVADQLVAALEELTYVEYAEKMPLHRLDYVPNDYSGSVQWSLQKINATGAWNVTTGSSGITVAIVDNGVNYLHQDLISNAWENPGEIAGNGFDDDLDGYIDNVYGYDVADGDNNPLPPAGTLNTSAFVHGTHCAGISSATTHNAWGISSIGFRTRFMSVKCASDNSNGDVLTATYEGVDFAISSGADVISMSFGSTTSSLTWQYLINAAQLRQIVMVGAAGNDNTSTPFYPAAYPYVIAVGATDQNDVKSYFSNYGSWVDVMAPGSGIISTLPRNSNTFGTMSGTSMAAPLVAGLASLVLSYNSSLSAAAVESMILGGCENIDGLNPTYTGMLGNGRINAWQTFVTTGIFVPETMLGTFNIFPNPGDGDFFITSEQQFTEPVIVTVYGTDGKYAASQQLNGVNPDGQFEVNFRDILTPGAYLLRFTSGDALLETEQLIIHESD